MKNCKKTEMNWNWFNNTLINEKSECLTSKNGRIDLKDCIYSDNNQKWKEEAEFLKEGITTSELTTTFSNLYYNLKDDNNMERKNFWDTRSYKPEIERNKKDKYIEIIKS